MLLCLRGPLWQWVETAFFVCCKICSKKEGRVVIYLHLQNMLCKEREAQWKSKSNYSLFFVCSSDMAHLSLHDHDGSSGGASDQDTVPPLPHPGAAPWPMPLPYQFPIPHPYDLPQPFHGGPGAGSAGSQHSGEFSLVTLPFLTRTQFSKEICHFLNNLTLKTAVSW